MGEEINGKAGQSVGRTETSRQAGAGSNPTDTRARAGAGARARAGAGAAEKTKVADEKLLAVKNVSRETKEVEAKLPTPVQNVPKQVSISTSEEKPEKKTRKRATKKKEPSFDTTQFDALLIGLTDYVASRPNMAHWKMSEKEVKSITEPLGNMIAKSEQLAKISEHSDAIALTLAVVTIFAPRIFITMQMGAETKKMKKAGYNIKKAEVKENGTGRQEKETGNSSGANAGKSKHTSNVNPNREDLSFLGNAIPQF